MFIEYKIYDPEAPAITKGLGEFRGIRYDAEFKLAFLVLEKDLIIVCKLEELAYSSLLCSIKNHLTSKDITCTVPYIWLLDDDSVDYIEESLLEAEKLGSNPLAEYEDEDAEDSDEDDIEENIDDGYYDEYC